MDFLSEAFKSLQSLTEETFDLSAAGGQEELKDFIDKDAAIDTLTIIDDEAETEEELQDSYMGKVILDCNVCHSLIYKDPSEVIIDEDGENCNGEEECPYCYSTGDGFKLIGQVRPFGEVEDELEDEESEDETEETEEETEVDEEEESFEDPKDEETEEDFDESLNGVIGGKSLVEHKKSLKEGKAPISKEKIEAALEDSGIFESCDDLKEASDLGGALAPSFSAITPDENMAKKIIGRKLKEQGDSDLAPIFSTFIIKFDKNKDENKITTDYKNKVFVLNPDSNSDFIYDKIVDALKEKVSESCDKNEACEKCGKNPCECEEELEESIQDMSLTTDDGTTVSMESGEEGEVTITTKPGAEEVEVEETTEETIEPEEDEATIGEVEPETEDEILSDSEEETEEETSEEGSDEEEFTDFDEESFEEMGESYLKKTYSNVESYKVSKVSEKGSHLFVEGLITFKSGNKKKTHFVFESKGITKTGKVIFEGFNKEITGSNKAFRLTGKIADSKFLGESLNYRYNQNKQMIKGKITR